MHGHIRIFYGYFGHVGIFYGYDYGKFLVVMSGHVKNFGGASMIFFFFLWDIDFFGGDFLLARNGILAGNE